MKHDTEAQKQERATALAMADQLNAMAEQAEAYQLGMGLGYTASLQWMCLAAQLKAAVSMASVIERM